MSLVWAAPRRRRKHPCRDCYLRIPHSGLSMMTMESTAFSLPASSLTSPVTQSQFCTLTVRLTPTHSCSLTSLTRNYSLTRSIHWCYLTITLALSRSLSYPQVHSLMLYDSIYLSLSCTHSRSVVLVLPFTFPLTQSH